jgi:uncharacterized protein (DUF1501 family)
MSFENENTRREFLKTAAAFGVTGGAITFDALNNIAVAAAPIGGPGTTEIGNDYKAIVCVYLYGGQDHANILIPWFDGNAAGNGTAATTYEYTAYAYSRSNFDSTDSARKAQTMLSSTGNLSFARTTIPRNTVPPQAPLIPGMVELQLMTLPATTTNELTGNANPTLGGWTTNTYGRQFALNPCYSELKSLYTDGDLAIMSNVGPLLSKVKRHDWFRDTHGPLPLNLYSHDDQTKGWMSGTSDVANPNIGIGGRIANHPSIVALNQAGGVDAKVSTQVSIDGSNTFMLTEPNPAPIAIPYQMGHGYLGRKQGATTNPPRTPETCNSDGNFMANNPTSPYCLNGGPVELRSGFAWNSPMLAAVSARYSATAEGVSIYHDQWRQTMRQSINTEQAISAAFLASPTTEMVLEPFTAIENFNGEYNRLAHQLRMVAAMIRASNQLGPNPTTPIKRQIFFVGIGGFDTHGAEFWRDNPRINRMISLSLSAFATALKRIRIRDANPGSGLLPATESAWSRVTTFTMSEFGRTLDSNNDGSDHGAIFSL